MKVLIANKYLYAKAGAEAVMFQEREYLTGRGLDVIDFSMLHANNVASAYANYFVSQKEYRRGRPVDRIRSALSLVHSREAVNNFTRLVDQTRPDIVHCHNIYHQLTPSIINAAKSREIPVILTAHDQKPVCPARTRVREGKTCSLCLGGKFHNVIRYRCADGSLAQSGLLYAEAVVQRWLGSYENIDLILAPSRYMRDSLLQRFSPERVVLLYNGVDTAKIKPTNWDRGYVLYSGRVATGKGIDTLLRAHAATEHAWPVVVAGDGPLLEGLRSRTIPNVRFTGHLAGDALTNALGDAALVVVPSKEPENCPMSILEAMAYGKPVVASRIGGIPELVDEEITGLLFDPEDHSRLATHVSRLMSEPRLRKCMGERGRLRAEAQFSLAQHNADLMKIYASLVSRPQVCAT